MSHIEMGAIESTQAAPSLFERWTANVERIMGHDLDGNELIDGYSIDGARDAWLGGATSNEYAARIQAPSTTRSAENRAGIGKRLELNAEAWL